MSGGHWDYLQYRLTDVAEDIKSLIEKNGLPYTEEEEKDVSYWERNQEKHFHYKYPDEVIEKFKEAYNAVCKAHIYMQRLDWLLSGDDGEETFVRRLNDDLKQQIWVGE